MLPFLSKMFEKIDQKIDTYATPYATMFTRRFWIIGTTFIVALFVVFIVRLVHDRPYHLTAIIKSDLDHLERVLTSID